MTFNYFNQRHKEKLKCTKIFRLIDPDILTSHFTE